MVAVPDTGVSLELKDLSPTIAAELATGLSTPESIRAKFGLTEGQWRLLARNPVFREMMKEAITKFRGDLNAGARITVKAEVLLEDAMPELYGIAKSNTTPASDRISAVKELANLAGRNQKKDGVPGSTSGFSLTINLSGAKGPITIEGKQEPVSDGS